jgi:hypothetical protein
MDSYYLRGRPQSIVEDLLTCKTCRRLAPLTKPCLTLLMTELRVFHLETKIKQIRNNHVMCPKRHLGAGTYLPTYLPTGTYRYIHVPTYIPTGTLYLPTKYKYLPTGISLYLPTGTFLYLPTSTFRYLPTVTYVAVPIFL